MIRKLTSTDNADVLEFLSPESSINLFIIGDIENFGYDSDIQDLWAEFDDDGKIRAVLLRYFHYYVIYAPGDYDAKSFAAIINSDPQFELLSGKKGAIEPLGSLLRIDRAKELYFAELTDDSQLDRDLDCSEVQKATLDNVDEIHELRSRIEEFQTTPSARDSLRKGMENGSSATYYYRRNGAMIASASITAENSKSAMIIGVCSLPEHRRKGYATMCMTALCRDLLSKGKTLCLFYDNPDAGKIYKRIGFRDIGKWKMYHPVMADQTSAAGE